MNVDKLHPGISESISMVVDHYNRYPGENVTFTLRFTAPDISGCELYFSLPRSITVESYHLPPDIPLTLPSVIEADQYLIITIPLTDHFSTGQTYTISIQTRLDKLYIDHFLTAEVRIVSGETQVSPAVSVRIAVFGQGNYLKNLPDFYGSDDFTSRFMMFFESFWKPISKQIDQVENYFDPDMTPPGFIPWLSSWLGLQVDDLLPLDRVRKLLKNAMMLFQRRGTHQALKTYLEIFSEGEVNIIEHQAENFVLGAENTMGMGIALGTGNQPGTISINLALPREELIRTKYSEEMYQRKITKIVRSFVPAHTNCRVNCEFQA